MKSAEKIDEITALTELLALNAMMESVRMGQNGADFAARADELKTLSIDSQRLLFSTAESLAVDKIEGTENLYFEAMENLFGSLNGLARKGISATELDENISSDNQ